MQGTGFSRYISTIGIGVLVLGGIVVYKLLNHKDPSYPTESLVTEREPGLIRYEARKVQDWTNMEQQGWVETTYHQTETNPSSLPIRVVIDVDNWTSKAGHHLERPLNNRDFGFKLPIAPQNSGQKAPNRSMPAPPYWTPHWIGPAISPWHGYSALPRYPRFALSPRDNRYNLSVRPRKPGRNMCFFLGFN